MDLINLRVTETFKAIPDPIKLTIPVGLLFGGFSCLTTGIAAEILSIKNVKEAVRSNSVTKKILPHIVGTLCFSLSCYTANRICHALGLSILLNLSFLTIFLSIGAGLTVYRVLSHLVRNLSPKSFVGRNILDLANVGLAFAVAAQIGARFGTRTPLSLAATAAVSTRIGIFIAHHTVQQIATQISILQVHRRYFGLKQKMEDLNLRLAAVYLGKMNALRDVENMLTNEKPQISEKLKHYVPMIAKIIDMKKPNDSPIALCLVNAEALKQAMETKEDSANPEKKEAIEEFRKVYQAYLGDVQIGYENLSKRVRLNQAIKKELTETRDKIDKLDLTKVKNTLLNLLLQAFPNCQRSGSPEDRHLASYNFFEKNDIREFFDGASGSFNIDKAEIEKFNEIFADLSTIEFPQLSFTNFGPKNDQVVMVEAGYRRFFVEQVKFFLVLENGKKFLDEFLVPQEEKAVSDTLKPEIQQPKPKK